jgi:hypothetical protein
MAAEVGDARQWPLEGHFVVGGAWGLQVHTECLGETFTSRTASHDLEISLPQRDTPPSIALPEQFQHLLGPPAHRVELVPPRWKFEPVNQHERQNERNVHPVWGIGDFSDATVKVYPESARNTALVGRCGFYTTVEARNESEFTAASSDFLNEFEDWWNCFTDWVSVVAGQDFIGLGGSLRQGMRAGSILSWTADSDGNRIGHAIESRFPEARYGIPQAKVSLEDLRRCVAVTGRQNPPAEWLLIRDARLLLNAGHIRRAVLDAGTAAEIAMTLLVDRCLDDLNTDDAVKDAVTSRHDNLGRMAGLLRSLRSDLLPPDVESDLIPLRNIAIHGRNRSGNRRWDQITVDEAIKAFHIAAAIVDAAYPLDDLLASQPE